MTPFYFSLILCLATITSIVLALVKVSHRYRRGYPPGPYQTVEPRQRRRLPWLAVLAPVLIAWVYLTAPWVYLVLLNVKQ